ncbi:outer membrane protein [Phaeobacter sp. C3_T13_0]|uniref:outer membrane protein n=1 Tax=Phaeobacter cretensis TaxID=3342641 RepID=UPI0039BC551A
MTPAFFCRTDENCSPHAQRRVGCKPALDVFSLRNLIAGLGGVFIGCTPVLAEDWSGVFLGASITQSHQSQSDTGSTTASGLHLGYDHDFGRLVLGGEIEVDRSGRASVSPQEDHTHRVKLRAGYDMGQTLGYVTIGSARNETATDSDNGAVYGLGVSYSLNRALRLSGEYLHQDANDGAALQAPSRDILSIRASFRF